MSRQTGHRIWQEDGRGTMSRITFNFYTVGTVSGLVRSVFDTGATAGDSIIYDAAWGNVSAVKSPSGIWSHSTLDRYGRDSLSRAPIDTPQTKHATRRVLYDLSDRATQILSAAPAMPYTLRRTTSDTSAVPAETLWVNNEFDKEGNLTNVTSYGNNDAGVDQITEVRTYDRANRLKSVAKGSGPASFTYDAAGNPIRMQYRSGKEVTEEYDALNRRTKRIVPQMDYAQSFCTQHQLGLLTDGGQCLLEFPLYPNNGTGYRVAADTLTFVYDIAGNMTRADNRDARISRSYYSNGLLETDSIALRDVIGYQTGFSTKYGIRYRYDRNGRRTSLRSALSDSIGYIYSSFGMLGELRTNSGNRFRFTYDAAGRVDTLVALSSTNVEGMREWRRYDVDGQLRVRERRSPSIGILTRDQLAYDARGKILEAHTFSAATDHIQKRTTMAYSGLGPILASEVTDETLYARWELEEFRPDRFGNNYYRKRTTGATGVEEPRVSTFGLHSGALTATRAIFDPNETEWSDELAQQLDLAGNVVRAGQVKEERVSPSAFRRSQSASVSYYTGDNRLMAMQRYDASLLQDGQFNPITGRGTWEEYRYDALGRRVVTIVRRGLLALCSPQISPECDSYEERVVWDGDDCPSVGSFINRPVRDSLSSSHRSEAPQHLDLS
jgi:YD repeat-containing protein